MDRNLISAALIVTFAQPAFAQWHSNDCAPPFPAYQYVPCAPSAEPQADQQNDSVFTPPPTSGEVAGESNSLGLRGFAIHIPQSTIRLPTIQMPALIRYRRGAEMITDQANATLQARPEAALQFARQPVPDATPHGDQHLDNCLPYMGSSQELARERAAVAQQIQELQKLIVLAQQQKAVAPRVNPAPAGGNAASVASAQQQWEAQYRQKCAEVQQMQAEMQQMQKEFQLLREAQSQAANPQSAPLAPKYRKESLSNNTRPGKLEMVPTQQWIAATGDSPWGNLKSIDDVFSGSHEQSEWTSNQVR